MLRAGDPTVSVVIPTRHRPEAVLNAVRSALQQTLPPSEVIVVVDGPDPATLIALARVDDARVHVVALHESLGAAGARNAGVSIASGELVAFLDDDDLWLPQKLHAQVEALTRCRNPEKTIVSTAAEVDNGHRLVIWPLRAPKQHERVADYLFVRDRAGEGTLFTPTLLLSRDFARQYPMPTHIRQHEEWDWLLDLEAEGAQMLVVMTPLVKVDARRARVSVSNAPDWRKSLDWALTRQHDLGKRGLSGFILNDVARSAVLAHASLRDYLEVGAAAFSGRPRVRDLARFIARPLVLRIRRWRHQW